MSAVWIVAARFVRKAEVRSGLRLAFCDAIDTCPYDGITEFPVTDPLLEPAKPSHLTFELPSPTDVLVSGKSAGRIL